VDNDGNPLVTGAIYFNTTSGAMRVYNVSAWQDVAPVATSINLATQVTGTLAVANGGTGAATLTGVLKGNGTSAISASNVNLSSEVTSTLPVANGGTGQTSYTNGEILIGNTTGNTLAKSTLTAGSGISITNGAGSITIAALVNAAANSGSRIYLSNSFGGF
jgi:hypothetical protein